MSLFERINNKIKNNLIIEMNNTGSDDPWDDNCLLYTSPSPRDATLSRMPSSA